MAKARVTAIEELMLWMEDVEIEVDMVVLVAGMEPMAFHEHGLLSRPCCYAVYLLSI